MLSEEIERKFLVTEDSWRTGEAGVASRQAYVCTGPPISVRVRVADGKARLNLKRSKSAVERDEFEYEIPEREAEEIIERLCEGKVVEKTRYRVEHEGRIWEIDEFRGENAGLVVAEIELERADETFAAPPWLGAEVSDDPKYLNASLSRLPYNMWR